jgi:hypothetical protein
MQARSQKTHQLEEIQPGPARSSEFEIILAARGALPDATLRCRY